MKDKMGRDIQLGDTLVGELTQERYTVVKLGAFPHSDLVIERQFRDGIRRPWCCSYLNSFFAGLCYSVEPCRDLQEVRHAIEQHAPWLEILGVVGESQPLLAVKDTRNLDLCVAFGTEADLSCYLMYFGKGVGKQEHRSRGEQES